MVLPTLMPLIQRSGEFLVKHGIANGKREAEWLFAASLGLSRMELYLQFDRPLAADEVDRLRALVQRRGRREPLAYCLGSQPFHGLDLAVGTGVLVPRPETEELVDHVLAALPAGPARVLDVGSGSGAIALAIKHARGDCAVDAVEVSAVALEWARRNGAATGLAVEWRQGDLAEGIDGPFDAVVANLPYIAEDERALCDPETAFEPSAALFAGDAGLALIARLIADAPRLLAPAGVLWLEHGFRQGSAVRALAQRHGLRAATLVDLAGHERFARIDRG